MHEVRPRRWDRLGYFLASILLLALLVEVLTGSFLPRQGPRLIEKTAESSTKAVIVFPGYAADCASILDAFTEKISPEWTVIVVCYGEGHIDEALLNKLIVDRLKSLGGKEITFLAGSMGGMVAVQAGAFIRREESVAPHTINLILDTCPADAGDVRVPRTLLSVGRYFSGGSISSLAWDVFRPDAQHPPLEPGADPDVVRHGDLANRRIGTPTLLGQADYIYTFDLTRFGDLSSTFGRSIFVEAAQSQLDPLVDVSDAYSRWQRSIPGIELISIESRQGPWHIPWTERPNEILQILQ